MTEIETCVSNLRVLAETETRMPATLRLAADEIERLEAKLRRVRDWIKFAANSENGIVAEIDETL